MPYVVTATTPYHDEERGAAVLTDRTAVATLDEANRAAYEHQRAADANIGRFNAATVSESGGTIGPLPDGTTIEVRYVGQEVRV